MENVDANKETGQVEEVEYLDYAATTVKCPVCSCTLWNYQPTYGIRLSLSGNEQLVGMRTKIGEEIRCDGCHKKATIKIEAQIRQTSAFKQCQELEERINVASGFMVVPVMQEVPI